MNKMTNTLALLLFATMLTNCANEKSHIKSAAPQNNSEVGYVVKDSTISRQALEAFVIKNHGQLRMVNEKHHISEIFGIAKETIVKELAPDSIFKNSVKKIQKLKTPEQILTTFDDKEEDEKKSEDEESSKFLDCKEDPSVIEMVMAPTPVFTVSLKDSEEPPVTISQNGNLALDSLEQIVNLKLEAKNFTSKTVEVKSLIKIFMPSHTGADPVTIDSSDFEFKLPMAGTYQVVAGVQSKPGAACRFISLGFFSSDNPELETVTQENIDFVAAQIETTMFSHLEQINALEAQEVSGDKEVLVAILDTGIDYNHPMLNKKIALNESEIPDNGIDDDDNGMVDDYIGIDLAFGDAFPFDDGAHGTHVAGLIGAEVTGVSQNVKFIPVKVGSGIGVDMASTISGIYYAVDRGAQIINASLGAYEYFKEEQDADVIEEIAAFANEMKKAIEYASKNNVLFVSSSGNGDLNDGKSMDNDVRDIYPASLDVDNILSVTALDENNKLAPYANFGKTSVDIAAPGGIRELPLFSTVPTGSISATSYNGMNGTSMAAPVAAGVAALVLSSNPDLTPSELINILMKSGDKLESLKDITVSGSIVNALTAVENSSSSQLLDLMI